jgi:hypothetical protein
MTESLSPYAHAVLDVYWRRVAMVSASRAKNLGLSNFHLITAIRAAVGQAHPKIHIEDINYAHQNYVDGWKDALDVILAIADELEKNQ